LVAAVLPHRRAPPQRRTHHLNQDTTENLLADPGKDFILLRSMRMSGPTAVSLLILLLLPPMISQSAPLDARGNQFMASNPFPLSRNLPASKRARRS